MNDEIPPRDFGKLEAQVAAIDKRGEAIAGQLIEVRKDIAAINKTLSEAKGGWRMLLLVGGAGGSFGAFVMWLASYIRFH